MMRSILWLFPVVAWLAAAAETETKVRVPVPKALSEQAARRLAGDTTVASPVLILEGVQTASNRGLTIEISAEDKESAGKERPLLAVTGTVAREPSDAPNPKTEKIDIPVPLNEKSARLLANRSEIVLVLKTDSGAALKLDRAYFREPR